MSRRFFGAYAAGAIESANRFLVQKASVFDLHRHMVEGEARLHEAARGTQDAGSVCHIGNDEMPAHRIKPRGNGPDMQIVHDLDAGDFSQGSFEQFQIDLSRDALEQDVDRLAQEPPGARDDEDPQFRPQ